MTDKKLTVKRLIIFLVISFLPFIIIVPIMNSHFGKPIYECEEAIPAVYALGVFGMLIPSAANIITRLATKEGFRNSYLGLNIEGNVKYYAASIWVKLAEIALGTLLLWAVFLKDMTFSEVFSFDDMKMRTGTFLLNLAASVIVFFPAFGEEWGWRGYMMPKLMELLPKPAAVAVGGIIWGLWHAPLTLSGHNFETTHWGYPWLGIVLMCTMCITFNTFLTLITERTKSVYPASFCHMVNNNFAGATWLMIFGSQTAVEKISEVSSVSTFFTVLPISVVIAVVSMVLLMKKKDEQAE
ncbi:MAG: CPBP family intramembrane metalloprotease [Oscillospiraceae bacterium]|nr:CPBP family intramembrane metalloprotease [Oscillospiraceae bacterium]